MSLCTVSRACRRYWEVGHYTRRLDRPENGYIPAKGPVSASLCEEKQEEHCQSFTDVYISYQSIHKGGIRTQHSLEGPVFTAHNLAE